MGIEGLIVKAAGRPYRSGGREWLKVKHYTTTEVIIEGLTGTMARPQGLYLLGARRSDLGGGHICVPGLRHGLAVSPTRLHNFVIRYRPPMARTMHDQEWDLVPFERVGPLRFGMARDEVIQILGQPDRVLRESPLRRESHHAAAVQSTYDPEGNLMAVQVVLSGHLLYAGGGLTGRPQGDVEWELRAAGLHCDRDDEDDLVVPELGLAFYSPGNVVEAVMVRRRDYAEVASRVRASRVS